jgi:cytochrome c2
MSALHRSPPLRDRAAATRGAIACALLAAAGPLPLGAAAADIGRPTWVVPGGDARRGAQWIGQHGCAASPTGARGNVGPPLERFATRTYIAGMLRNEPANLVRWIRDPQGVVPGNAMPDMGISEAQARDIAAYLYACCR